MFFFNEKKLYLKRLLKRKASGSRNNEENVMLVKCKRIKYKKEEANMLHSFVCVCVLSQVSESNKDPDGMVIE